MAMIIDGKAISAQIKGRSQRGCGKDGRRRTYSDTGQLCVVGDDPASHVYVRNKKRACEYTGIRSLSYELPGTTTQDELLALIGELNRRADVDGILVQLPLPQHMNEDEVIKAIDPDKDVDGFHPYNVGTAEYRTGRFCFMYAGRHYPAFKTQRH